MLPAQRLLKILALTLALLILPQCSEKGSEEHLENAIRFSEQGDYPQAKESFQKAVDKDPNNAKAWLGLGGIYNSEKNHGEALKAIKKALSIDPTYVEAYYSLGFTYENLGDRESAEREYEHFRKLKAKLEALMKAESGKS